MERLTKQVGDLDFDSLMIDDKQENLEENPSSRSLEERDQYILNGSVESSQPITTDSVISGTVDDMSQLEYRVVEGYVHPKKDGSDNKAHMVDTDIDCANKEVILERQVPEVSDNSTDDNKQLVEKGVPHAVLPLLRYHQCESSESSSRYITSSISFFVQSFLYDLSHKFVSLFLLCDISIISNILREHRLYEVLLILDYSFQGSPSEDRHFRSDFDETETEEASFSGQDDSSQHSDIVEWAKV